jgi:PAS domain S-box-containing protein
MTDDAGSPPTRRRLPSVTRVVLTVDALGLAGIGIVATVGPQGNAGRPSWWVLLALLAVTCAGELTCVRLRHGGSTEDLTLFEAAVVITVLLLPPSAAVVVPVLALAVASAIQRRPPIKAAFNLGTYAAATTVLVVTYHLVAGGADRFSARSVVGLCLGALGFAVVNLVLLARVLSVVEDVPALTVVREGARLSAFMAIGNVAAGSVAVAVAAAAPALLPFVALPAVAITYAYRAAAQEQSQRERSTLLLDLSSRLARRLDADDLLTSYLEILRAAFHADVALSIMDGPSGAWPTVVESTADDTHTRPATTTDVTLLHRAGTTTGATYVDDLLPDGWRRCLLAGFEAADGRVGVLVLGSTTRELSRGDLTLLTPLASALGVALRGAGHLEQLVEETGKLKALVEHSSDGILVLDGAGRVLVWNPAMAALAGVEAADAERRPLDDLLTTVDPEGNPVGAAAAMAGLTPESSRATVELGVVRPDGEQRWLRCSHAAIFDGPALTRDVVIAHDVTRERQVDRLKADFIATVSHELRTPMTPIKGYTDLLRKRGHRMTPEKRGECLDIIADRVSHLGRLVEDLLLASRITSPLSPRQHVALQTEDLGELTRRAAGDFPQAAARVRVDVPAEPVPVACDGMRTIQVITNLISNAMKYSAPSSAIDVVVDSDDAGAASVTVIDRGRGIPADQLDQIFEKFHRVEDPLRMTTSGTGLGLFIARQLATAMGGDIAVRSTLGVGSAFTLTLPRAAAAPVGSVAGAAEMTRTA